MKKARVPRYLHLPVQILWFDVEDIGIALIMYILWMIVDVFWLLPLVILVPYYFHRYKANKPRGYVKHLLYAIGMQKMPNYPAPTTKRFDE